jgi:hypothetical protein
MRSRARALVSRTENVRTRVLVGASLGAASLAALPVAADLAEEEGPFADLVAEVGEPESAESALPAEAEGGDLALDRWYSPEEAQDLSPEVETIRITMADAEDPEPATQPVSQEPEPAEEEPAEEEPAQEEAPAERNRWDRLAECESGEWVNGGESFIEGSARWDYGINFTHEGYEQFQGGLNFHPGTWDAYRDADMPDHAGNATREQEIVVAERVLADQGWEAWPRCSQMVGLR